MTHLNVCTVAALDVLWVKARADLHPDRLIVTDRSSGPLREVVAPQEELEPGVYAGRAARRWKYGDVVVSDMPGACGCGGLQTQLLSNTTT